MYQVYRGEYGLNEQISTLLGSITFTNSIDVAKKYAKYPNPVSRIYYATIKILNPWINNKYDPFIDFNTSIVPILGEVRAKEIAMKYSDYIVNTQNWQENYLDEYNEDIERLLKEKPSEINGFSMLVWPLLDDPDIVRDLKSLGYDGAIYAGFGSYRPDTLDDVEYRIFDNSQILTSQLLN